VNFLNLMNKTAKNTELCRNFSCQTYYYGNMIFWFKVAPYSFTVVRALRTNAHVNCARSKENVSIFRCLLRQHEHKKQSWQCIFSSFLWWNSVKFGYNALYETQRPLILGHNTPYKTWRPVLRFTWIYIFRERWEKKKIRGCNKINNWYKLLPFAGLFALRFIR